jgi:hypothetical protein
MPSASRLIVTSRFGYDCATLPPAPKNRHSQNEAPQRTKTAKNPD